MDRQTTAAAGHWIELLGGGRAVYTIVVILGTSLQALQMQVIAIIMPTVVADIGGAPFYTWTFMLYTLGAIVGSSSIGPVWGAFGARRSYALSGIVFLAGTVACALAPSMAALVVARAVQGYAGGLVMGGTIALIVGLYEPALRTRIFAISQGTFTVSHLFGPLFGGLFVELDWWRGSFWIMVPFILVFNTLAFLKVPDHLAGNGDRQDGMFPFLRLSLLAAGVFCVALAGPVHGVAWRVVLFAAAVGFIALTFQLDRRSAKRLYPSNALSLNSPVGLTLWIMFTAGAVQIAVTLFLPLLLTVVHGVPAIYINFLTIIISLGWSVGTFGVSGWTGQRERLALLSGPPLMILGLAGITITAQLPLLPVLALSAFLMGFGIGVHNVHLYARTMSGTAPGEEHITAAAMPSVRSLGVAFGSAFAGMLAGIAGLTDVTDPAEVGPAITFVYGVNLLPLFLVVLFMVWLVRRGRGDKAAS